MDFITLDLSKNDLIRLICSYSPSLKDITKFEFASLGCYRVGSFERWEWDVPFLFNLTFDSLVHLYFYLKDNVSEYSVFYEKKE